MIGSLKCSDRIKVLIKASEDIIDENWQYMKFLCWTLQKRFTMSDEGEKEVVVKQGSHSPKSLSKEIFIVPRQLNTVIESFNIGHILTGKEGFFVVGGIFISLLFGPVLFPFSLKQ